MRFFTPLFLFFCGISALPLAAQNRELDSLERVVTTQQGLDRINTLNSLAWHYRNSHIGQAFSTANEALRMAKALTNEGAIATSMARIGDLYEVTGKYDSALHYFNNALEIKRATNDTVGVASTLNGIAMVYDQLGDDEKALTNYFEALRTYERMADPLSQAMVLVNIGIVYKKQKEYEKTIEYYQKALNFYQQENSLFGISAVKGNIGAVLLKLARYEESIKFSQEAIEGYKTLNYRRLLAYSIGNAGIAYDSLGNASLARNHYHEALALHQENNNQIEIAFTLKNLASYELRWGNARQAQAYAEKARNLAEEIKATEILMQSLDILVKCAINRNDYEQAFAFQKSYNLLKDRAFEEEKTKAVFELEAKYETEKKDRSIELQRLSLIEKDLEIQKSRMSLVAMAVAILCLLTVGLLVRARLKLKFQRKLEEEKLAQQAARQEELLRAVIASVEVERKRFSEDLHDSFGQLISLLKMKVDLLTGTNMGPDARQQVFDQSVEVLNDMYGELKNVCFNLMPKSLVQHGLPTGIRELLFRINQAGKIKADCYFFGLDRRLADIQEISLYRIVQEWTNNILKYSDATQLTVQLTRDETEITLTIEDDGMGFDQNLLVSGKGNGWKNLQSRTNLMKGAIDLDTLVGRRGNMLTINVPLLSNSTAKDKEEHVSRLLTYSLF